MVHTLNSCYTTNTNTFLETISVKWNNANHSGIILNVDGSCLGSSTRVGYGGLLRNDEGFYLSGFSGYIPNSSDIMYVELYAIFHGLLLTKDMGITNLVCYSDSLHYVNIIKGTSLKFHVYVVFIKDTRDLIEQGNVSIIHTPFVREINVTIWLSLVLHKILSSFITTLLR